MIRFWLQRWREGAKSALDLGTHVLAFTVCFLILIMVVAEKFTEGGWITLVVTTALIALCTLIRRHYRGIRARVTGLSKILEDLPLTPKAGVPTELTASAPTAVMLVASYSGLGVHSLLAVMKTFPRHYQQVVFASVSVIDSGTFKGEAELAELEQQTVRNLESYVDVARRLGLPATARHAVGTDPVSAAEELCAGIAEEFPRSVFFGGKLIFKHETWYSPRPAQRNGLRDPAPAAVARVAHGDPAGARLLSGAGRAAATPAIIPRRGRMLRRPAKRGSGRPRP